MAERQRHDAKAGKPAKDGKQRKGAETMKPVHAEIRLSLFFARGAWL